MCCDQLVCAACAHPVSEGRCPTCRATRSQMHDHSPVVPLQLVVALLALAAALALIAHATT